MNKVKVSAKIFRRLRSVQLVAYCIFILMFSYSLGFIKINFFNFQILGPWEAINISELGSIISLIFGLIGCFLIKFFEEIPEEENDLKAEKFQIGKYSFERLWGNQYAITAPNFSRAEKILNAEKLTEGEIDDIFFIRVGRYRIEKLYSWSKRYAVVDATQSIYNEHILSISNIHEIKEEEIDDILSKKLK